MPEVSIRIFIVSLPPNRPELAPHLAALEGGDGWERHFHAVDATTGERVLVQFRRHEVSPTQPEAA